MTLEAQVYSNTHFMLASLVTDLTRCGGSRHCKFTSKDLSIHQTDFLRCSIYPVVTFPCGDNGTGEMAIILHQSSDIPSDFHRSLRGIPSVLLLPRVSINLAHPGHPGKIPGICGVSRGVGDAGCIHAYRGICVPSSPHSGVCPP